MNSMPAVLAIGTANPDRRYSQEEIYNLLARHSGFYRTDRVRHIFMTSDIDFRHLFFDSESFHADETPDELHERFARGAMEIGTKAVEACLASGKIDSSDIGCVIAVSCTGYLCPGLSALLTKEFDLQNNVQRADILGMGCAGAMPGLQRAFDYVKAYPAKKALVVTAEICSACYYIDDSLETVVGNAICSDGAAAVVIGMSESSAVPKISGFETHLEPSLIHTVGFEQKEGKLRIVLSKDIRDIAGVLGDKTIGKLLEKFQLKKEDITHWILHSGGRKVIGNLKKEIGLTDLQVRHSRCVLQHYGNMSSPTVLFVLEETLRHGAPKPGDRGVMLAMGPGLAIEAALLVW